MAALAPAPARWLWTDADINECAVLIDAVDADHARWALGDFLLRREPMAGAADRTGSHRRLDVLAERVGCTGGWLRMLRTVSYSWPPATRTDVASWHVMKNFTTGGPARAASRAEQLEAMPRGVRGRVTTTTLAQWRDEQQDLDHAAAGTSGSEEPEVHMPPRPDEPERAPMPPLVVPERPEFERVAGRIRGIVRDVDQLVRAEGAGPWKLIRDDLDRLYAHLEVVATAAAKQNRRPAH